MWSGSRAGPMTAHALGSVKAPSGLPILKFRSFAARQLGPCTIFAFH